MFGNLFQWIKKLGWYSIFGSNGVQELEYKHGSSKRNKKNGFKGKAKWDLVQSCGAGMGLFKCRQNGECQMMSITNTESMSKDGRKWFNRAVTLNN